MKNLAIKALAVGVCAVSFAMADGSYFGVNGGYSNVKIDDFKESVPTFGIVGGADLTPEISSSFRLFLGGYLGLSAGRFKANGSDDTEIRSASETLTGFLVGVRAGMLFDLNGANQLEFGAKVDKTWFKDGDIFEDMKQTKYGGYVGYNHKF